MHHARAWLGTATLLLITTGCHAPHVKPMERADLPPELITRAEQSSYAETGRYDDAVALCRRLARSPWAHYTGFGSSGEGRDLPLLILSTEGAFTPEEARRSDRVLLLVENAIHAGECMGKDACLELARDMLILHEHLDLLDHVNLLIVPIFNVDGHERFGPYNRINQNGPREMGWRTTAANYNLNRDFMKADSVEMQAWLQLWTAWEPDVFIDTHSTDGADHQYDVAYSATTSPGVAEPIRHWTREVFVPGMIAPLEAGGFRIFPYAWPRDRRDLTQGIEAAVGYSPRYSTGYGAVCNRPTLLVETHALKPYQRRVRVTYALLVAVLETLNRDARNLKTAIREADRLCTSTRGGERENRLPIRIELTDRPRRVTFKAFKQEIIDSEIAGGPIIRYTDTPQDIETSLYEVAEITESVTPPAAYLIPPQWQEAIARINWHGLPHFRLRQTRTLEVESYRFEEVSFPRRPYEGHFAPRYEAILVKQRRTFPAGTVVVPMDHPRAKLAAHLLEPSARDALVAWGFFNVIFEQKEYFESYIMEPIAREMLATDPDLQKAFEEKLAADENFARNPRRRLDFFYKRSPWYDQRHNLYPVGRFMDVATLRQLATP
jgi:hypothetical protein